MAAKRWQAGAVVYKQLDDDWIYYARLLEFPWSAFYRCRTRKLASTLDAVTVKPVMFIIAVHKSFVAKGEWQSMGIAPLERSLRPPAKQAIWDDRDHCQIIDARGRIRSSTPKECKGLEPAAVWEPEHVADRLKDTFARRKNHWLEEMIRPPY